MGSKESKPKKEIDKPSPPPRNQKAQLGERQKEHFNKKLQHLIKIQKESPDANTVHVERNRSPYSDSQSQLNQAAGPQPTSIYPNLNTLQQQSPSNVHPSTSDLVQILEYVNTGIGNAERHVPVPSAPPAPIDFSSESASITPTAKAGSSTTTQAARHPAKSHLTNQIAKLMERQKEHIDKKVQHSIQIQKEAQAANTAHSPIAPTAKAGPSTTTRTARNPAISPLTVERSRSPYSDTRSQRSQLNRAAGPHPNQNTLQQQSPSNVHPSTSDFVKTFVFRNKSGYAESFSPRSRKDNQNKLKCHTCKKTYGLTIFQCSNGHSSCSDCKETGRVCGKCYVPIGNIRNIRLEKLVSEIKVKCPYSEDGCILFIKMADREKHTKKCPFRELSCPLSSTMGCLWTGKLSQVAGHFDMNHPMNCQGAVDTEMTILNPQNNCQIAHLVVIGSYKFIFHLMVNHTTENIYMAVQLIGPKISASRWTYEVHVYNKDEPSRKFQYIDVCTATNTNIWDLISEAKCAVLHLSYASTFICDDKLNYKFNIKKEANETAFGNNRGRRRGRGGHNTTTSRANEHGCSQK